MLLAYSNEKFVEYLPEQLVIVGVERAKNDFVIVLQTMENILNLTLSFRPPLKVKEDNKAASGKQAFFGTDESEFPEHVHCALEL